MKSRFFHLFLYLLYIFISSFLGFSLFLFVLGSVFFLIPEFNFGFYLGLKLWGILTDSVNLGFRGALLLSLSEIVRLFISSLNNGR